MTKVQKVGINDMKGFSKHQLYYVWAGILQRCFSKKFYIKQPTYKGCTIDKSWLYFSSFYKWAIVQDWKGNAIDKDILKKGNKHYSPQTCIFVPAYLNNLLTDSASIRGSLPIGVKKHVRDNRYEAYVKIEGKKTYVGGHPTSEGAHKKYILAKNAEILRIASKQSNPTLIKALLKHRMKPC